MIVLPIVDRELRVAARRAGTYRIRLWAALAAMLLAAWKCLGFTWQGLSPASQGRSLFYTLSGLAFLYCLGIGARVTSDCVSEEKREGTLGLLFLTDLRGLDVVFGKLAASSLNSFYGLLAVVPLLAMSLLLGGVTFMEFSRMVLVLLNALFFSLSVGLFVSTVSRNERKAMFGTVLAVLSPALIPFSVLFFMVIVLEWFQDPSEWMSLFPFMMVNPIFPFLLSLSRSMPLFLAIPDWSFWVSLAVVHGLSWMVLIVSAIILPAIWKDRPRTATRANPLSLTERWRVWSQGDPQQRRALRASLLGRNPYLWLVSRDRLKPAYTWFFLFSMIAVWLWGYWQHHEVMFDFYPLVPTVILVHGFLKVWVISEVSHRLVEDQRNGALELLLSTPLGIEEILEGQRLALIRQFGRPVLALCAIEMVVFRSAFPLAVILPVLIMLVADLFTLMWVGMRLSLSARGINEVLLKGSVWVLFLPWMACLVAWPLFEPVWRHFVLADGEVPFIHRLYFWFAVGILNDVVLVLGWARPQLLTQFRETGLRRFSGVPPWFQRWLPSRLKPEV
jgi:ABC-type transport system involved in multi-copper enzyme maturation permease subunit